MDGRYGYQPHGIAVGGSPCVWCGGGPCTSYSDAVCEPQSWLKQGQGKAGAGEEVVFLEREKVFGKEVLGGGCFFL